MNLISRTFGGETNPIKKFSGKIKKQDVVILDSEEFAIMIRNDTYENIIKSKYGKYMVGN